MCRRTPPKLDGGEDTEEAFAQSDEGGQQHHHVRGEVVRLKTVELEERPEEAARRQAEAAQAVRAEDDPLALLQRRRDLPRGRQADLYAVGTGQAPGLAKELHVVFMDVGAVPRA